MESGYYPPGAEYDPNAPYNQTDLPEKEIEVLVSVTLSKTVKVRVSDYKIADCGKDEDGDYFESIDYSECDLQGAVKDQIVLPQEAHIYIKSNTKEGSKAHLDLMGWNVDEMECIID